MFKYGLNIFIAPSTVVLPPMDAVAANPRVIRVPRNTSLEKPVRIDVVHDEAHRADETVIIAEEGSRAVIVEHLTSAPSGGPQTRTSKIRIEAGAGSNVTHISVQNFGAGVHDFTEKRATVGRDAAVTWLECVFGGSFAQSNLFTRLAESGASVRSRVIFFGDGRRQFDIYNEAVHAAPNTTSDIVARGALTDNAKTIYRGLIRMEKGAFGSVGTQKERTLLLSEDAEIDAVPNLEINVDDVRCSHSAASGSVDPEQMFYLMSRGLDEKTAIKTLVEGFFTPVLKQMTASGLEEVASCIIAERLAPAI